MKIYTKTGDKGETSLIGGTRVKKNHERIEAYGTVDELNSFVGLLRDQDISEDVKSQLERIQDRLFVVGSFLASDPHSSKMELPDIEEADVSFLEEKIDNMNNDLPELRNFILPGGNSIVSYCHIARCVCRRAERLVVGLADEVVIPVLLITFLNRLSDYLFVLSRYLGSKLGAQEYLWIPSK